MNKISYRKRWIAYFLVFVLGIQNSIFISQDVFANNINTKQIESRSSGEYKFNLEWRSDNPKLSDDKKTCYLEPKSNISITNKITPEPGTSAQCVLEFSLGDTGILQPEEVEIRLPRYLFEDRAGNPQGDIDIGVADIKDGPTGYYYYIDTKGDTDKKNDEIVITNFREIDATYVLVCGIQYFTTSGYVSNIPNKYKQEFQATLNVSGTMAKVAKSNSLIVEHHTSARISSVSTNAYSYNKWQSSWGTMPEDSKDNEYFYILWRVDVSSRGTQPYTLSLTDTLQDAYGGEIIGYGTSSSTIKLGSEGEQQKQQEVQIPSSSYWGDDRCWYVLTKYRRNITDGVPDKTVTLFNKAVVVLSGVDDGVLESKEATNSCKYVESSFQAPGSSYSLFVSSWMWRMFGFLERFDAADNNASVEVYKGNYDFEIRTNVNGYPWTLREGGDPQEPTHYGQEAYEVEIIDDSVLLEGEMLEKEDYEFTKVYMSALRTYDYVYDDNTGTYTYKRTDSEELEPIQLFYKVSNDVDWKTLNTIYPDEKGFYYQTEQNERKYVDGKEPLHLPANTTEVKAVYKSKNARVILDLIFNMNLKKSERVKRLRAEKSQLELFNVASIRLYDSKKRCLNQMDDVNIYDQEIYNEIKKKDEGKYGNGNYPYYAVDRVVLLELSKLGTLKKGIDTASNNTIKGRVDINYYVDILQQMGSDSHTGSEMKALGILREEREGVFYELLPHGMFVEKDTVKVLRRMSQYTKESYTAKEEQTYGVTPSIEWIENWRNTGRTMMIVRVQLPEGEENYFESNSLLSTGWHLFYQAYYPWESVIDYGNVINNSSAYKSLGSLYGGEPDDGGTLVDKVEMADLDGDSNPEGTKADTLYGEIKRALTFNTAADMSFSSTAKTIKDKVYTNTTTAIGGTNYNYRLRLISQKNMETGEIVLFDVLEQDKPEETNRWKGKLKGIDLSSPNQKGIDTKVYYSTKSNISTDTEGFRNLENTGIWSSQPPSDLSQVTALAFDMRKLKNGADYVMMPEEGVSIVLSMEAPMDNIQSYEEKQACAYNSCFFQGYIKERVMGVTSQQWLESSNTSVYIAEPNVELLNKTTPASGTEQMPQEIDKGGSLVYDLVIKNNEEYIGVRGIEIEEMIPEGLSFELSEIKWYVGQDENKAKPIQDSSEIMVSQDPSNKNKLTFKLNGLAANTEVHLLIPTVVPMEYTSNIFKNTVNMTKLNGGSYFKAGETSYHRMQEIRNITVKKKWEDEENKDQKRPETVVVQLLADGENTGKTITLSPDENNEWQGVFEDLNKFKNGQEIQYTIQEIAIPEYKSSIDGNMVDGYTITNELAVSTAGEIVWNDDGDRDRKRPDSIEIQLKRGNDVIKSVILSAVNVDPLNPNCWTYDFGNYVKYENGQEIAYSIVQTNLPTEYTSKQDNIGKITNSYTPEIRNITVKKKWEDGENKDQKRPETVVVQLLADGENTGKTITLSPDENNEWQGVFEDLNKFKNGQEIQYTIQEIAIPEYKSSVDGNMVDGYTITNEQTVSTAGEIVWNDDGDRDRKRPDSIEIQLKRGNDVIKNIILSAVNVDPLNPNCWTYDFGNYVKYENGQEIAYSIVQTNLPTEYTSKQDNIGKITNSYTPEMIQLCLEGEWIDFDNYAKQRPQKITVNLYEEFLNDDGEWVEEKVREIEISFDNSNEYEWSRIYNLPMYRDGQFVLYSISQNEIPNYKTKIDEYPGFIGQTFHITNQYTPEFVSVSGEIRWDDASNQDGKRPTHLQVSLYKNDNELVKSIVISGTALDVWDYDFGNQLKYENGSQVQYSVIGATVAEYTSAVNGYTITNTYTPGKISIPVIHQWDDGNNQDGKRPETVTLSLLKNGENTGKTLVLSQDNDWKGYFVELDEYEDGEKIIYTIQVDEVAPYSMQIVGDLDNGYTVINSWTPETVIIQGTIVWNDDGNKDKIRPNQVVLELYADNILVDSKMTTGEGERWDWNFENKPKYKDGKEIHYTVNQTKVGEYTTSISGDQVNGFVIKYGYEPVMEIPSIPVVVPPTVETKPEEPKKEEPIKEEPKKEEPKKEEPKKEEPKKEEPKKEEPKKEEPKKTTNNQAKKPVKENVSSQLSGNSKTEDKQKDAGYNASSNGRSQLELEEQKRKNSKKQNQASSNGKVLGSIEKYINNNKTVQNGTVKGYHQVEMPKTSDKMNFVFIMSTMVSALGVILSIVYRKLRRK